jgi:phosphoribosylpyrophosphate synthetase
MKKDFIRFITLLLISCQIADPATAAGLHQGSASSSSRLVRLDPSTFLFNSEALSPRAAEFGFSAEALNRRPTVQNRSEETAALRDAVHWMPLLNAQEAFAGYFEPDSKERVAFQIGLRKRGHVDISVFSDKEFHVVVHRRDVPRIPGHEITLRYPLRSADDFLKMILMLDNFKRLGARKRHLILTHWTSDSEDPAVRNTDADLLSLLKFFAEEISIEDPAGDPVPQNVPTALRYARRAYREKVRRLLYIQERFKKVSETATGQVQDAKADAIRVKPVAPGHWKVELPEGLENQNAVLTHSTENSKNIVDLLLTLMALQRAKVNSISLINTYEGYARQDKDKEPGGALSAITMLVLLNHLVGNLRHFAINVHYGEKSGEVKPKQVEGSRAPVIVNLNGFIPLAERAFQRFAAEAGFDVGDFPRRPDRDVDVKGLRDYFRKHPLIVVAPDDGAYQYASEAAKWLRRQLRKQYGIRVPVRAAYFEKVRKGKRVFMQPPLRRGLKRPEDFGFEKYANGASPQDCLYAIVDDVVSRGSTQASAVFILHVTWGVPWLNIFVAPVHWRGTEGRGGLGLLDSKLSKDELAQGIEPLPDREQKTMPPHPSRIVISNSLPRPAVIPPSQVVPIDGIIVHIIKRIIGQVNPRLLRRYFDDVGGNGTHFTSDSTPGSSAEGFGPHWPWTLPGVKEAVNVRTKELRLEVPLDVLRNQLIQLRDAGRVMLSDQDIDEMDVVIFGDTLRVPLGKKSSDYDIAILVPGKAQFDGAVPIPGVSVPVSLNIHGVVPNGTARPIGALVLREMGTLLYGSGQLLERYSPPLSSENRIALGKSLYQDLVDKLELTPTGLSSEDRVWKSFFSAYLVLRPLLSPDQIQAFERRVFHKPLELWFPDYYFHAIEYPWEWSTWKEWKNTTYEHINEIRKLLISLDPSWNPDQPLGPAAGALALWSPLLKWFGTFVTLGIAAVGEGTVIGLAAWHSHGHILAAITTVLVVITLKFVVGVLQPSPRGRWRGINFRDPEFRWSYFYGSVATQLTSVMSFFPAYQGQPWENVFVVAIVPHLLLNLWIAWRVWNGVPSRRYLVSELRSNDKDLRFEIGRQIALELDHKVVEETDFGHKRLHRLQSAYLPRRRTWEINVSPMEGYLQSFLVRALEKIGLHAARSGRIIFRFSYHPNGSSLHILTGTRIEPAYEGHGVYHEIVNKIIEEMPEPTVIWHDLNEIKTLMGIYDVLEDSWKSGYPKEAKDLHNQWEAEGKQDDQIMSGFRQIVWAAYYHHQRKSTAPLIPQATLESLKLPKTLKGKYTPYIDIIAEAGGGLWLRAFKGTRDLGAEPWYEAPEWLEKFWKSEAFVPLRLPNESNERLMRRWEVGFAMRYEERIGNWPPVELLQMTRYAILNHRIDTVAVDRFMVELPASEHANLTEAQVLAHFGEYIEHYNAIESLREGWDPYLDDLTEVGELLATQTYAGHPVEFTRVQAYWLAELLRSGTGVTLEELMSERQQMSIEQQNVIQDYQTQIAGLPDVIAREHKIGTKQDDQKKYGSRLQVLENARELALQNVRTSAVIRILRRHPTAYEQARIRFASRLIGFFTDSPTSRIHDVMYTWIKSQIADHLPPTHERYLEIVAGYFRRPDAELKKIERLRQTLRVKWPTVLARPLVFVLHSLFELPDERRRLPVSKVSPEARMRMRKDQRALRINYIHVLFPNEWDSESDDKGGSSPATPRVHDQPLHTAA